VNGFEEQTVEDDQLLAKQRIFYNQIGPAAGQI
jgi:hypothetical protein